MIFDNFKIDALPYIHSAHCKCGGTLKEVSNGFFSRALFCPRCKNVYRLQLRKVPKKKVSEEFIKQCEEEISLEKKRRNNNA